MVIKYDELDMGMNMLTVYDGLCVYDRMDRYGGLVLKLVKEYDGCGWI